jgi:hypothetical protein
MTGEMAVMDHSGDTKIIWDAEKPDEVETARQSFKSLRKKGYLAYKVTGKDGAKGEQIHEFEPDAERIILAPPMVGG